MSNYTYSGISTGESLAYEIAISEAYEDFGGCPSGEFLNPPDDSVLINYTGSGYTSTYKTTGTTGYYEVEIKPAMNPDYAHIVVASGCTQSEAKNVYFINSGIAKNSHPECPICLSNGADPSYMFMHPLGENVFKVNFDYSIQKITHQYDQTDAWDIDHWCNDDGEPECSSCPNGYSVLSGWRTVASGSISQGVSRGGGGVAALESTYTGHIPSFNGCFATSDIYLHHSTNSGHATQETGNRWYLEINFICHPYIQSQTPSPWNPNGNTIATQLAAYFNSGLGGPDCLDPINTGIVFENSKSCYAGDAGDYHPSDYNKLIANTYRVSVSGVSVEYGNEYNKSSRCAWLASGNFTGPSTCDNAYRYFHWFPCGLIDSVRTGYAYSNSTYDNCQALQILANSAPQSGDRIKIANYWVDSMDSGENWLGIRTGNPNGTADDCTITSPGSGLRFAFANMGGLCGGLVERQNDSGNWSGVDQQIFSLGTWSGYHYIDNVGCSGCTYPTGSGHNPITWSRDDCTEYNACVTASGHHAGC